MRKIIIPVLVLLLILLLANIVGCSANKVAEDVNVSIEQAVVLWKAKEAVIIDVRTPEEYRQGHIPGVALIPLNELADRLDEIPKDKKVLLICRSGNRSAQGTKLLRNKGFANVYNVSGGMNQWAGPIEQ